jgi:DNA-binding beta-propeller fold protein YncE
MRRAGAGSLVLAVMITIGSGTVVAAAATEEKASLIQRIDLSRMSPSSPDPSGIAYLPGSDDFIVVDGEVDEMAIYRDANLFRIDRTTKALVDAGTTTDPNPRAFSEEPTGAAFDPATETLIVADDNHDEIAFVRAGRDGRYGTGDDLVSETNVGDLVGSTDAEGVAFDTHTGHLYVVDGIASEVHDIGRGPDGIFGTGDDVTRRWDMARYGTEDPEGIAYNAGNRSVLVLGRDSVVYEIDTGGRLIRTIDCSAAEAEKPAGLEVAPSSTDARAMSLWLVDRGIDNADDSEENDGRLIELTMGTSTPAGPPSVEISAPKAGSSHAIGRSIAFAGSAWDARDGDLTDAVAWTSSRDGSIGTGASFAVVLSVGTHTITASVADREGDVGSASITLTVRNQAPIVTITAPGSGAWYPKAGKISFSGHATDPEDRSVTSSLRWTSNLDGAIGGGRSFITSLREGVHTITARARDARGAVGSASIKVSVATQRTVSIVLAAGGDDAEENVRTGAVNLTSSDLELAVAGSARAQRIGLRFRIALPRGARVTKATVQFRADEVSTGPASLSIRGQAADDAAPFRTAHRDVGSRAVTASSVRWDPPPWPTADTDGVEQRTPNLAPIVREILGRNRWASGNAVVLIISGAGTRTAGSFDAGAPPILHIVYR